MLSGVRDRWGKWPALYRHIAINMVVGLGIAILLIIFHSGKLVKSLEDDAMDWMMGMYRGVAHTEQVTPYAFIDIDQATYRAWGEPWVTPRDKLAELIRYAVEASPAAVIVDFDFSKGFDAKQDAQLKATLQALTADSAQRALPPVVFIKSFRISEHANEQIDGLRSSFIDDIVEKNPQFHWASSLFDMQGDQVVRHWRLWEVLCDGEASQAIASVQLLTYALIHAQHEATGLTDRLSALSDQECGPAGARASVELPVADLTFKAHAQGISRRIIYTLPWRLQEGESRPKVELNGRNVPLLSIRSARMITDHEQQPDSGWLRDKIVVIGASHADSRDRYATPLGYMPGALILVNAIDSISRFGAINPPPSWVKLLIEAILILVMSLAFAKFHSFWGAIFSAALIIALLLPISFMVFRAGIWLDFVIPLLAVLMHQLAAQYEEAVAVNKEH